MTETMQKKSRVNLILHALAFTIMLCSVAACASATPSEQVNIGKPSIQLNPCNISSPGLPVHMAAKCGKINVFEDRILQAGKQIALNFAVIPAVSRNPSPDPVFFLAGGPGEAATESYLVVAGAFQRLNSKRDIVLVDQRGTGKSNPLECQEESAITTSETILPAQVIAQQTQACLAQLPGDPRFYTTSIAVDDLDQVRQALGYTTINLYGASYGTRVALVYARQHPDHLRSLILDGVAPLDWSIGPQAEVDAQSALDLDFMRCQQDDLCRKTYPGVAQEFHSLLVRLRQSPAEVRLPGIELGKLITTTFSAADFTTTIQMMSYSPETVALLPFMVHQAYAFNDYQPFASQAANNLNTLQHSISAGMRLSVLCSEDVPFWPVQTKSNTSYLGEAFMQDLRLICENWPKANLPAGFKEPVQSSAPVLLISGEADPITPPTNAQQAAKTLPNSLLIVLPGSGHINAMRGCMPGILFDFIDNGSPAGLDVACVKAITPFPFFLNFNGPTP